MRRRTAVAWVSASVLFAVGLWGSPSEAAKDGSQCQNADAVVVIKTVTYQCAKFGKKLRWVVVQSRSGTPIATADGSTTTTTTLLENSPSNFTSDLLAAVNQERAAAGLGTMTECLALNQSALSHSRDMYARDFFGHKNPDGKEAADRIRLTGYLDKARSRWTGENIAEGFGDVASVMAAWMKSAGHRANILSPRFTHMGLGIVETRTDSKYEGFLWTQDLGSGGTC